MSTSTLRTHLPAARRTRREHPGAARAGAWALSFAVVAIVALHVLRPGLDPGKYAISQYAASGPYSWLAGLALVAMGGGALAVASALRAHGAPARTWLLVGVFGAGVLVAAAFPISPPGQGTPPSERVHGAAAFFAFASLTVAMLLSVRPLRADARLGALAGWTKAGGLVALVLLLGSDLVPAAARGTWERVYLGILLAWLLALAVRLARAASR
jgi:hypothetical protein